MQMPNVNMMSLVPNNEICDEALAVGVARLRLLSHPYLAYHKVIIII